MLTRRLALKKETLAALASEDLAAVNGGASAGTCYTCVVQCAVTPAIHPSVFAPLECYNPTIHRGC